MLTEEELNDLQLFFKLRGYTWSMVGGVPNKADLKAMLANLINAVNEEPGDADAASGRLLVKKINGYYEFYVLAGDIKIESD